MMEIYIVYWFTHRDYPDDVGSKKHAAVKPDTWTMKTLCGLIVPEDNYEDMQADVRYEVSYGNSGDEVTCKRCEKAMEKLNDR